MIERAMAAGVPFSWVVGDEVYGNDRRLRVWLEQQERPHVLAIRSTETLWAWVAGQGPVPVPAKDLATAAPADGWQRLSAGAGSKGERVYDWARWRLCRLQEAPWDHWLLVRRTLARPEELKYYVVFGPADTHGDSVLGESDGNTRKTSPAWSGYRKKSLPNIFQVWTL